MTDFIRKDFLLHSDMARDLYDNIAADLPIIDYHCHLDTKQIAEDVRFTNISDIWLSGDHYKWRLMRAAGIEERYITGDASPKEKFLAWAKTIGMAWGNPLYHWTALELARYFDIYEPLSEYNAEEIWDKTSKILSENEMTATWFLKKSKVELVCTTDDPVDDLKWHKKIAESKITNTRVLPTFRPDRAVEIGKVDFADYISKLSEAGGIDIRSVDDVKAALSERMDHFAAHGCKLSDHGLERIPYLKAEADTINDIFIRKMSGAVLTDDEIDAYKTDIILFCANEYNKRGWTMQLHFGCRRNNNEALFSSLGADVGGDTIAGSNDFITPLAQLMSDLSGVDSLPKMILYSLDPTYNAQIDTLIGCFQKGPDVMKIQHGSAWWFNDNMIGIKDQMRHLALQSYFPGFIGMLTDSRSFLSYPRHEYFRRILCDMIAESVEAGEFPDDKRMITEIIRKICHDNAASYFA